MTENLRTFRLGAATITVITTGTLQVNLAEWLRVPKSEWPPKYFTDLAQPILIPMQSVHIALSGASILVDACHPDAIGQSSYAPPNYQPPPSLLTQLTGIGVDPGSLDHVIITHRHFDHYSGIVVEHDGRITPSFPKALHYLGRADWADAHDILQDPTSLESRTLSVIQSHGRLELVDQQGDLGNGIQILAAPGETPGHQIVRVQSEGQTLYCLGDLFHHPIEVEHPEWMVYWADRNATYRSRKTLIEAALAEDALLLATHIPTIGRVQQTTEGIVWEPGMV